MESSLERKVLFSRIYGWWEIRGHSFLVEVCKVLRWFNGGTVLEELFPLCGKAWDADLD